MQILIINGPNLNLLGKREVEIYGKRTFEDYFGELSDLYGDHDLSFFQSNSEGELVDKLQEDGFSKGGIVINAGAYAHTSVALADAIAAIRRPVVAVHISNTFAREEFRNSDLLAGNCVGLIAGLGLDGYRLAVEYLLNM